MSIVRVFVHNIVVGFQDFFFFGGTPESSVVNKSISFMMPDFHIAQQFMFDLIAFGMPSFPCAV